MKYITIYNILVIIIALTALTTSYLYYFTNRKMYLLISALFQSFFLLEILNIKLHRSNARYKPTVIQLFFRMFIIWIVFYFYECTTNFFCVVTFTWYFTDCIRYLYYLTRNTYVKFLRYNLFIIFYPISIYIEFQSMFNVLTKLKGIFKYLFLSFIILYIPCIIFLILHMFKQRKWANKKHIKSL